MTNTAQLLLITIGTIMILLARQLRSADLYLAKRWQKHAFFSWIKRVLEESGLWLYVSIGILLILIGIVV